MENKTGILAIVSAVFITALITSVTVAFAYEDIRNNANPIGMVYNFLQNLKFGEPQTPSTLSTTDTLSASVISKLKDEVDELTTRVNSLENPSKIHTTELLPVTGVDCSNRNMVEAFLSGWCPHPARNIYFIEDSRVHEDSIIAISLDQNYDDGIEEQSVCGVINQDVFNFSFQEPETGEVTVLEDLHGFIMKCDQSPILQDTVLKYTIINS